MAQLRTSLPASEGSERASVPRSGTNELTAEEVIFSVSAEEIEALDDGNEHFDIIGQPRALRALRLAVDIVGKGYNVFATGLTGTGKRTAIMRILKEYRPGKRLPKDIAYVHNFKQADQPRVLSFDAGEAVKFRARISQIIDSYRRVLSTLPFQKGYKEERDRLMLQAEGRETQAVSKFEKKLNAEGFEIVQMDEKNDQRADISPIFEGKSASFDDLQRMVSKGKIQERVWSEIREKYYLFIDEMKQIFHSLQTERTDVEESLQALQIDLVRPEIEAEIAKVRLDFQDARVHHYLDGLTEDLFSHMNWFRPESEAQGDTDPAQIWRYGVNVIVDHSETQGVPIIFESHPDYQKLFGSQDTGGDGIGERVSNFMQLRAGSLLQASGGFLILRAEDVLNETDAWNSLKRALQDGNTEIRPAPSPFGPGPSLNPEAVEIAVKVIIMGSEHIYDYLYGADEEFQKLFKVPAEFDSVMIRNETGTREYLGFIRMICRDERLRKIDFDGIAAVVEYGVRLSEFRDRLSTQFSKIADLIREADYWAGREHRGIVSRRDVHRALQERKFLYDLPEEKIDEQILSGELLISVRDRAVGRINGLAIIDRGYYSFARPILITARVSPGSDGIINIERESGLSGEIHDKGIYILEGYLQSTYARSFPLSMNASVAFEQSYVEVDGDSASSTEVYVILSAIADIALRQDIAVSGSVNQMGQIQPVGGITEKVEGFFEICKKIGLTSTQGVIIPRQNLPNLILTDELQYAVVEGRFHIYTAETIDEGMEILTGMEAGSRTSKKGFPAGTINALVEHRLHEMAELVKEFGGD